MKAPSSRCLSSLPVGRPPRTYFLPGVVVAGDQHTAIRFVTTADDVNVASTGTLGFPIYF